jgi:hypothetical protein
MTRVYIVDTSYLLEVYAVPGFSAGQAVEEVRKRFESATREGSRLFVPTGCLFELCNHVADVRDGKTRSRLARKIADDVDASLSEHHFPWRIAPVDAHRELRLQIRRFAKEYVVQRIGLTDTQVVEVAASQKRRYGRGLGYFVHIWTRDKTLKALEPDPEPRAFV